MDRMFVNLAGDSTECDKKKTERPPSPPPIPWLSIEGRMGGRDGMAQGGTSKVLTVTCLAIFPGLNVPVCVHLRMGSQPWD